MRPPFGLRLAQTIAWCAPFAHGGDPALSLRSERMRPFVLPANRQEQVDILASRRAFELRRNPAIRTATSHRDLDGGRLLVHFPSDSILDEASQQMSRGFFDVTDTPPWDTWIEIRVEPRGAKEIEYLVSWVPPGMLLLAGAGIRVNATSCVVWLEDAPIPTTNQDLLCFARA